MFVGMYVCMYVGMYVCLLILAIVIKDETSVMVGNKSNIRNKNGSKKTTTAKALHCFLSQSDHR